ncbi:MAG TPA: GNAT family N-acetyltransferase [Actinomycetota bacterium]|nr:GNAT family N-acetyltransferase [Actinomycetota bacterium]
MADSEGGAEFARAVAFEEALVETIADTEQAFRWGTALFTSVVPGIYDLNFVRVDAEDDAITAETLAAECDRLMAPGDFAHRKVVVTRERVGARVAAGFAALGWRVTKLVWMVHRRPPDRSATTAVDEIAHPVHTAAKEEFNRRDPYFEGEEVLRQMRIVAGLVSAATDKRCFAAYVDGAVASMCELYSDGSTAQIEDVATLEEYRGRGLGTSVVLRALSEAQTWNHDMIFLVADEDDWPKKLYEEMGFDPVGRTYQFLLTT